MSGGLWYSSSTAVAWACHELLKGREISHPTEIGEVGGWRLGAIIHVLRKRYKWPIITERRGPAGIAYYRLGKVEGPLELPKSARNKESVNTGQGSDALDDNRNGEAKQ